MKILTAFILWIYIVSVIFMTLYDAPDNNTSIFPKIILGISVDKIAHFILFLIFTVTLSLYKRYNPQTEWIQPNVIILLIGILFAVGTESLQLLTPTRSFCKYDIFANVYGIVTGLMISNVVFRKHTNNY